MNKIFNQLIENLLTCAVEAIVTVTNESTQGVRTGGISVAWIAQAFVDIYRVEKSKGHFPR